MISEAQLAKKPEDVGIDSERLEALFARARRDVEQGLLGSVQVAVARQGRVAGMRTFGEAVQDGRKQPATERTLYPLFSCTKGIVGIATWALLEEGLVRLDERVADIVPGFGANGKGGVTVGPAHLQSRDDRFRDPRPHQRGAARPDVRQRSGESGARRDRRRR